MEFMKCPLVKDPLFMLQYALQQHQYPVHHLQQQTSEDAFDSHVQERLQQQKQQQQQQSSSQQQHISGDISREPSSQGPVPGPSSSSSRLAGPTEVPQEQLIEFSSSEADDQPDASTSNKTFQRTETKLSTKLPPPKQQKQKLKANVSLLLNAKVGNFIDLFERNLGNM